MTMRAINECTGKYEYMSKLIRGIVYVEPEYIEYGYFPKSSENIVTESGVAMNMDVIKDFFIFDNSSFKYYYIKDGVNTMSRVERKRFALPGQNMFPYSFRREYECL